MTNGWHVSPPRSQQPPSSRARPWITQPKEPLERVLEIGGQKALRVMGIALAATLLFHGAAAARTAYIHAEMINWTRHLDAVIDMKLAQQVDIETDPAPPRRMVEEEKRVEPLPAATAKEPQPVVAAQAANIVAKNDDVLDFGNNVFDVGKSERFAGGATMSNGTNDKPPTTQKVAETGAKEQTAPPQILAVDLSRTATLAGSGEWRCPFPSEADSDQVDEASAIIEVIVSATGKAQTASVLQDPGHGFGREARSCAMRESYVPALDKAGSPVASSKKFRVKFER